MGNSIFTKSPTYLFNKDLTKSMLQDNIEERLLYIENKIDILDAHIWKLEGNTKANLEVISSDLNDLYSQIKG